MAAELNVSEELRNWLENEGRTRFVEAMNLSNECAKNDPDNEPYKSKYAAREVLLDLKDKLHSFGDADLKIRSLRSVVNYELALNHIETDEISTGEDYINTIMKDIEECKFNPDFGVVMLKCLQQLGMIWNERGDFDKSLLNFNKAEIFYNKYKEMEVNLPLSAEMLFQGKDSSQNIAIEFENSHTYTLFYLTQLFKNNNEYRKSAEYSHKTLQRQLSTKQYVPEDWALHAATLSQYHIVQDDYVSARHCLAAANQIINECDVSVYSEEKKEKFCETKANIYLCWNKYCLNLLRLSAENQSEINNNKNIMQFEGVQLSKIENEVPFEAVNGFEQARLLFLAGQQYLNMAKQFYKLDGYVVKYVEIIQDHSQLFKYLSAFEDDLERKCKMYKRRIDMLAQVLTELNPQHYLLICRQLMYEIASIYDDMADLKMEIVKTSHGNKPSLHQIHKINSLHENCTKYFANFIHSFKENGRLPDKFESNVLRVILLAHVHLARAYTKQIYATTEETLKMQQAALDLYKYVVDYCDHNVEAATVFHDELIACREMVDLIPMKLDKISQTKV